MEDYAMRRREYVQQIRASFDRTDEVPDTVETEHNESEVSAFFGFKMRLLTAIILFLVFLFCKYNSYSVFELDVTEIIDIISDNQYYTFLQKYVNI